MATVEVSVAASADDCRVRWNGSAWTLSLVDTEQTVGYSTATDFKVGGGMRFLDVNIPNGATITAAYLTLIARNNDANNTVNAVLIGEKSFAPATFSNITNYQGRRGTIVGGANDNNITSASVPWNGIAAITAGTPVNTPSIVTIVQEWADLAGRAGDGTDDMVVFLDDHAGSSTAATATYRRFSAQDHTTYAAPLLHIEYTAGTTYEMVIADGLKVGDSPTENVTFGMGITDGLKGGDSPSENAVLQTLITDGLKMSDTPVENAIFQTLLTDGLALGDAVALTETCQMLLSDGVKLSDLPQTQAIVQMLLSEGITLSDALVIAKATAIIARAALNKRSLGVKMGNRILTSALPNRSLTLKLPSRSLVTSLPDRSVTLKVKGDQ